MSILKEALTAWEGKHAHHALSGIADAAAAEPALRDQARAIAEEYVEDGRGVVRKAAKSLLRALGRGR